MSLEMELDIECDRCGATLVTEEEDWKKHGVVFIKIKPCVTCLADKFAAGEEEAKPEKGECDVCGEALTIAEQKEGVILVAPCQNCIDQAKEESEKEAKKSLEMQDPEP